MKHLIPFVILLLIALPLRAADDYQQRPEYQALRDSMRHAFNDGDSARFYPALSRLEDYLLAQGDLHAYYTQRCNEIVFLMNRQRIFEAFKLARQLSNELQDRKLDKEMYMAYNMLGHINRYCGNKEAAKQNFKQVIEMMEHAGYYESMPPIYMNIVNVTLTDNPDEARQLLDRAAEIAAKYAPDRVFDIETRRSLSYFNAGNIPLFLEGYKKYREGVARGESSVHGRSMEIYYEACMGHTDKAVDMARKDLNDEGHETVTMIYERAGRWKEAYESLKAQAEASDSINNVVLSNSMEGLRDQLRIYDMEREAAGQRTLTLAITIILLSLLIVAMCYILFSRRRHMEEIKQAYEHALESDKMKTAFIRNMSHEVRTPLNVISGFAQVLADPELTTDTERRKEMAQLIMQNTNTITRQIDEMLILALNESSGVAAKDDVINVNKVLTEALANCEPNLQLGVTTHLQTTLADNFTIKSNAAMLKRLLDTLLDNAAKNTNQGSISLRAERDDNTLTLTVEDTGCGIPVQEAEHIFERFVKLDTFKPGLGLGLAICRIMATRLNGTVTLDTSYRQGARFVVKLIVE